MQRRMQYAEPPLFARGTGDPVGVLAGGTGLVAWRLNIQSSWGSVQASPGMAMRIFHALTIRRQDYLAGAGEFDACADQAGGNRPTDGLQSASLPP